MSKKNYNDFLEYQLLYDRYKMLSLNMFRWEGLPETIESRYIENALFNHGLCLIVNDENLGFVSTPCNYIHKL